MNPLGVHPAHLSSHTAAALIFIHMGRYIPLKADLRERRMGEENRGREREDEGGIAGGGVSVVNRLVEIAGFGFRCWAPCDSELAENTFYV